MKLIVHGTDGSPEAEEALNLAIELAKDAGAKLAVVSVHVVHTGGKGISPPITEVEQPHGAEHLAEAAVATARAAGIEAKAYAVTGEPGARDHAPRRGARRRPDRGRLPRLRRPARRAGRLRLPRHHGPDEGAGHGRHAPPRARACDGLTRGGWARNLPRSQRAPRAVTVTSPAPDEPASSRLVVVLGRKAASAPCPIPPTGAQDDEGPAIAGPSRTWTGVRIDYLTISTSHTAWWATASETEPSSRCFAAERLRRPTTIVV